MARFVAIQLDKLPQPDAIQVPDYEVILAARKENLLARVEAQTGDADLIAELRVLYGSELEPLVVDQEVSAERELIVLERVNDGVRAVLLPTAKGADLDNICARLGVERMRSPANAAVSPPTAEIVESDERLRERYQLALEAFSTCGSYGAYRFHSMTASLDVRDVGIYGPEEDFVDEGRVHIYVLSRLGDGTPSAPLLAAVNAKCSPEEARPLADWVHVYPATIATYAISVHLLIRRGADPSFVAAEAERELAKYADDTHRVGAIVALGGLYDGAHSANVIRTTLISPVAEVAPGPTAAPSCTGIIVTWEVADG